MATETVGTLNAVLSAQTASFDTAMRDSARAVENFEQDLNEAKVAFDGLEPRLNKITTLARDLSGVFEMRAAEEYAQAVKQVGDASMLTAEDQAKVNAKMVEAIEHYRALGKEAPAHLVELEKATRKVEEATKSNAEGQTYFQQEAAKAGQQIKATALGYLSGAAALDALQAAGRMAIDFLKSSVSEALSAEQTQRKLTAALQAQGLAVPAIVDEYGKLQEKYAQLTVHTDDAIAETQTFLTMVGGVLPSQMDKALDAVTNLSAALGIDLKAATLMVAKGFEDNFTALKKYVPELDTARAKAEGMDYVLGVLQKKFSGQAQAEVESYAGKLGQLNKKWDEFKETVGFGILNSGLLDKLESGLIAGAVAAEQFFRFAWPKAEDWGSYKTLKKEITEVEREYEKAVESANALASSYTNAQRQHEKAMAERNAQIRRDNQQREDDERRAAEERKKRMEEEEAALQRLVEKYSGAGLQKEVTNLQRAYERLTPAQKANVDVQERLATDALALAEKGAVLTTTLEGLAQKFYGAAYAAAVFLPKVAGAVDILPDLSMVGTGGAMDFTSAWLPQGGVGIPGGITTELESELEAADRIAREARDKAYQKSRQEAATQATREAEAAAAAKAKYWQQQGSAMAGIALDAATGASGEQIAQSSGQLLGGIVAAAAAPAIVAGLGMTAGTMAASIALGAATMGIGTAVMLGAMAVQHWLSAGERINDARDEFMASLGGLEAAQALIAEHENDPALMESFERIYTADDMDVLEEGIADFTARLKELTDETNEATAAQQAFAAHLAAEAQAVSRVRELTEQYGISFDALGNKIVESELHAWAASFADDFEFLILRGADLNTVLVGMADEAQTFLDRAEAFGIEIPASMRPLFTALVDAGLLVDDAGKKIEDINDIEFGEAEGNINDLADLVEALPDRIAEALIKAFGNIEKEAEKTAGKVSKAFTGAWGLHMPSGAETEPVVPSYQNRPLEKVTGAGLAMLHPGDVVGVPFSNAALLGSMQNIERALARQPVELAINLRSAMQTA